MNTLHYHIPPVYSEEHPDSRYQIGSVRLLRHQAETWEAFHDPSMDVIFNTAMTGDGKSLAAYLPVFKDGKAAIAMYPTNELIQDQFLALPRYEKVLDIHLQHHATMYGEEITRVMKERDIEKRLEAVRRLLKRNPILLTNPDLVHLIMSHQYGWDYLRKELPTTLSAQFDYFVFDEFHVFGVPQIISVMDMLGYLAVNYRDKPEQKKYIFLSATPNKLMDNLLERSGLRTRIIEGHYSAKACEGYRRILQPCELELHELSQETPIEAWVEAHLDEMQAFFKEYPRSKAAILVYSVAAARRLYKRLCEYFEPRGISVGENTGLTYRDERRAALEKQILVGTSTVDIGIDFHVNYLIFEASNAGSFLQRFGRLGRHEGFDTYRAYGLIPRFVLERLQQSLAEVSEVDRETFNKAVREAFPLEADFKGYTKRWGVMQAAQVLFALQGEGGKRDANDAFLAALTDEYEQLYGAPEQPIMPKKLKQYWAIQANSPQVAAELSSFRGHSPLSCSVWDVDNHLKTYDLFFLLTNTELEVLPENVFMEEVKRRVQTGSEQLYERDFLHQLLYLKVHGYIPDRQRLVLGINRDLLEEASIMHKATVCEGFFVREPIFPWKDSVNKALKAQKLVCIFSDWPRAELRRRLNLPALFPIQRVQDRTGQDYSVAFGQEALLLDSLLFWRKTNGDNAMFV